MAQVYFGGADMFDAAVYGRPNSTIYQFIDNQVNTLSRNISESAKGFFQATKDIYQRVSFDDAVRKAKAVTRKVNSLWDPDGIYPITNMASMQNANLTMQRWIMANPEVRSLFHQHQCEGYSGTYKDIHPGRIGEDHYDYRRAMNGFVVVDDEGWKATTYFDELLPGDVELDLSEQVDIQTTWKFFVDAMNRKEDDPTSKFNSSL